MKIIFTKHVLEEKMPLLQSLNWNITKAKIRQSIERPKWRGMTKYGQLTALVLVDKNHILRIIFEEEGGIIRVITIHIARRGTYESTKED